MKSPLFVVLALSIGTSVSFGSDCTPVKDAGGPFNSQLTTVLSLAKGTGVEKIFDATEKWSKPITLFLPTNAAFGKLPTSVTAAVTKDADLRSDVLNDHALPGRISLLKLLSLFEQLPRITSGKTESEFTKAGFPQSIQALTEAPQDFFFGARVFTTGGTNLISKVELNWGSAESAFRGAFRDGSATILGVDYETCVGVVHVIDTVITRNQMH